MYLDEPFLVSLFLTLIGTQDTVRRSKMITRNLITSLVGSLCFHVVGVFCEAVIENIGNFATVGTDYGNEVYCNNHSEHHFRHLPIQ